MLHSSQGVVILVHLLVILSGRLQGAPPDSFSSGDISRDNRENLGRTLFENVPEESRELPPNTFDTETNPDELENQLERRVPRGRHGRTRGRGRGTVEESRHEYTEELQHEDLQDLQYADHNQLGKLVKNLQLQIKESRTSQVRTRSILNVLQEKQVMQERNLQILKDEIQEVREAQQIDHQALMALRQLVSDSAWAVNNLKTSQDNIRYDCVLLKQTQAYHNDTILDLGNSMNENEARSVTNQININQLNSEFHDLRHLLEEDRASLRQLQNIFALDKKPESDSHKGKNPHSNKIPAVPNFDPTSIPVDSSGVDPGRVDQVSSSLEEERNTIGHSLEELMIHKDRTQEQMEHIQQKFFQHDAEFSRFYTMFYNLSLQVSNLENKLLVHQKSQFDTELAEMQRMFMNFTQQMFHLEQWGTNARTHLNTSSQNQMEISQIQSNLENHKNRIRALEDLLLDYRTRSSHNLDLLLNRVALMNDTVQEVYRRFGDHHMRSSNVFTDVEERIMEFRTQQMHTDDRITRMEVKLLNSSLEKCERNSNDLLQDMKLNDFSNELQSVDSTVTDHESKLKRLDRGFSQLYQEIERHTRSLGDMMRQTSSILTVVPDVDMLKDEIHNIVMDLPRDCTSALDAYSKARGVFLLRPERSEHSLRIFCEDDPEGTWTIIQRRLDGALSFARNWDDYKTGFGQPDGEFWIGNDNLHYLTTQDNYILHLDMWDLENNYYVAEYDFFKVDEESTNYRLHIDGYSGNSTDALRYSNFMPFSTMDRDNDVSSTHCAKFYTAGWWYKHCHYSNLNGRYTVGVVWFNHNIDEWVQMQKTVMKIRLNTQSLAPGSGSG